MLRFLIPYRPALILILVITVVYQLSRRSKRQVESESQTNQTDPDYDDSSGPRRFQSRLVAVGDLHGDLPHAVRVLRMAGLIDIRNQWIGKNAIMVQTGDIVDRGKDTIFLYQLMARLRTEAQAAGGAVVDLLGNHEYMNALNDWRYVTQDDIETFGGKENRRKVMSSEGWIGRDWMANYSVTARVPYSLRFKHLPHITAKTSATWNFTQSFTPDSSDPFVSAATAFVHGGITPEYAKLGISEINQIGASLMRKALDNVQSYSHLPPGSTPEEARFYSEYGPLWDRSYALEEEKEGICEKIEEATKLLNVRRLVMGHTPQFQGITSRCGGKILLIDTGISSAYGGPLSALEIVFSLKPEEASGKTTVWTEQETVYALQEGKLKKTLASQERLVKL